MFPHSPYVLKCFQVYFGFRIVQQPSFCSLKFLGCFWAICCVEKLFSQPLNIVSLLSLSYKKTKVSTWVLQVSYACFNSLNVFKHLYRLQLPYLIFLVAFVYFFLLFVGSYLQRVSVYMKFTKKVNKV